MSYFKRIGTSISVKSKELVRSAKAASETSSLNNIVKAEQRKIDTNYKMMGKLYYEKFSEGPSEDFEEYVAAIKVSMEKIDETNEEIAKIRRRNCCPECGARFKYDAMFCSKCGTRVREEPPVPETAKCPNCGNILAEGDLFCDGCGAKVAKAEEASAAETDQEQTVTETAGNEYIETETAEKSGTEQSAAEVQTAEQTEDTVPAKKVCPSCGKEQDDSGAVFCVDCGAKL